MTEGGGGVVTYLEVATQLRKFLEVPTPNIMYGHMMAKGGEGVKNCLG